MAQEVKNDIKKALQVNTIPLIAIMTAVTTVLTMLVKIPTPDPWLPQPVRHHDLFQRVCVRTMGGRHYRRSWTGVE